MNILDISSWTDSSEFRVKRGTIQFLQLAYQQIVTATLQALLSPSYNPATVYVLFGVQNSLTAPFYSITGGAIFYQGEVFLVDATTFTATGSNVGVFKIVTTQYTTDADPVTFTDSAVRNVHNIRKIQVVQGASGSGISDFSAASYCNFVIPAMLNLTATGQAVKSGVYPNINIDVPVSGNLCPVLTDGRVNVGDVPGGGVTIPVIFSAPLANVNYRVMLTLVSQGGSPHDDTTVSFAMIDSSKATTGFSIRLQEWTAGLQSLAIDYIVFAKHNP